MLRLAPEPVRNRPPLPLAILVQVVVPAKLTLRVVMSRSPLPPSSSAPLKVVAPVPVMVPLVQVDGPEIARLPVPDSVPPVIANVALDEAPFSVSVPDEMFASAVFENVVLTIRDPPVIARFSSLVREFMVSMAVE